MRTVKLTFSYDGTGYSGFQRLTNQKGIQNILEDKLSFLCGEPVEIAGSGRTDAGVHALCQVVSLETDGRIPLGNLVRALNSLLPGDIRALAAEEAAPGFHARKSACWKRYEYRVRYLTEPDPFSYHYVWQIGERPELPLLNAAAACISGTHDFSGFQSSSTTPALPVKTIYESAWTEPSPGLFVYRITGSGFVYHMVRNLVWSMMQAGLGRKPASALAEELRLPRGAFENSPAPAQGLYLAQVGYVPWPKGVP